MGANAPFRDCAQIVSRKCSNAHLITQVRPAKAVEQFAPSTLGPAIARGPFPHCRRIPV
jgi:hypothetical protein